MPRPEFPQPPNERSLLTHDGVTGGNEIREQRTELSLGKARLSARGREQSAYQLEPVETGSPCRKYNAIQHNFIAKCQSNCTMNVLWCQVAFISARSCEYSVSLVWIQCLPGMDTVSP